MRITLNWTLRSDSTSFLSNKNSRDGIDDSSEASATRVRRAKWVAEAGRSETELAHTMKRMSALEQGIGDGKRPTDASEPASSIGTSACAMTRDHDDMMTQTASRDDGDGDDDQQRQDDSTCGDAERDIRLQGPVVLRLQACGHRQHHHEQHNTSPVARCHAHAIPLLHTAIDPMITFMTTHVESQQ
eukprot:3930729-Rhodomonas_salina.1